MPTPGQPGGHAPGGQQPDGHLPNEGGVSASVSGSFTEAQVVSGGQQIVITLVGDTWVATGATFDAQRQNIIDSLVSAQTEVLGWNNEVRDNEVVTAVVRTTDEVVTITLSAAANYDITANETIAPTIPATALTSGVQIVSQSAVTVTATASIINFPANYTVNAIDQDYTVKAI